MFIPGFIITWITFPCVIVHERPSSTWRHVLIGIGPLFINTLLGFALGVAALPLKGSQLAEGLHVGLMWLAISVAMHSFPSTGDAKAIWNAVWHKDAPALAKVVGTPLVGVIYAGAIGSFFWADAAYGVGVVVGLPKLLHIG